MAVKIISETYTTTSLSILVVSPERYTTILKEIEEIYSIADKLERLEELFKLLGLERIEITRFGKPSAV